LQNSGKKSAVQHFSRLARQMDAKTDLHFFEAAHFYVDIY